MYDPEDEDSKIRIRSVRTSEMKRINKSGRENQEGRKEK
jgi:hypothetical protein